MNSFRINVGDDLGKDVINDSSAITPIGSIWEEEISKGNTECVDIVHVCSSLRGSLVFMEENEYFSDLRVEGTSSHVEILDRRRLERRG